MNLTRLVARAFLALAALVLGAGSASAAEDFKLLRLDSQPVKWGQQFLGSGARVTYAFADRRLEFPEARNCRTIDPLDEMLAKSGISRADLLKSFEEAAGMWEAVTNVVFVRVEDPAAADIVIGARGEKGGWAFADVLHRPTTLGEVSPIERASICFNPERRWKLGFDGNTAVFDLRYTAAHELGHAIGLDHAGPSGQVMSFKYEELYSTLQEGDSAGAVKLYGPPLRQRPTIGTSLVRQVKAKP